MRMISCLIIINGSGFWASEIAENSRSGRLGRTINLDFVLKERIQEVLLSSSAFFPDLPTVSNTKRGAFGFSAVVYNKCSRRSDTRRTAYLHDSKTVWSGENRRWKLRRNSCWLIISFSSASRIAGGKFFISRGYLFENKQFGFFPPGANIFLNRSRKPGDLPMR